MNRDLESVHTPSLIQPHRMCLVLREVDSNIVYATESSILFLGVTPCFILERTLHELLGGHDGADAAKAQ
jgi:light-regulated signal transduction histidine kinase (bacteriophytochrome)